MSNRVKAAAVGGGTAAVIACSIYAIMDYLKIP